MTWNAPVTSPQIEPQAFLDAAGALGFGHYLGVPCSYLTSLINCVINDRAAAWVCSANEGDAVATAAGLATAGRHAVVLMQNSGLGNAVNPLTSLAHTFGAPMLLLITRRGGPGRQDEPQHALMGRITPELLDLMEIPWAPFPAREADVEAALALAGRCLTEQRRPYALLLDQGTFAPHALRGQATPLRSPAQCQRTHIAANGAQPCSREQALREIVAHTPPPRAVVIATTGYTGRELYALKDRANQLYMVGSMGCAAALALGVALARPDLEVTAIDGDGAGLMRMGNFATLGSYGRANLAHILLDNEAHESTGAQATVAANVSFADVAHACGYGLALSGSDLSVIKACFAAREVSGARFAHVKISPGTRAGLPRPQQHPKEIFERLSRVVRAATPDAEPGPGRTSAARRAGEGSGPA